MPVDFFPIIGLTTFHHKSQSGLHMVALTEAYVNAVAEAGACPVLIPPTLDEDRLAVLITRLDGIVFTGGGDIDPGFYHADGHLKINEIDSARDRTELYLLKRVVNDGKPFLGICRGLQLVNVGLGGTLYADIADQVPGALRHDFYPDWPRNYLAHPVRLENNSRLANLLGREELQVNSLHHQAIARLASGLKPTGYAPDGIVESIELPDHPFGLAVQWHPEWLTDFAPMRALFEAFVRAAGGGVIPA